MPLTLVKGDLRCIATARALSVASVIGNALRLRAASIREAWYRARMSRAP
ncbi:hypothetical protein [Hydrogenophaga sp.]